MTTADKRSDASSWPAAPVTALPIDRHLAGRGLRQQHSTDRLIWRSKLLDQHSVQQRYETLCHAARVKLLNKAR